VLLHEREGAAGARLQRAGETDSSGATSAS